MIPKRRVATVPRIHTLTIGDYEIEPPEISPLPLELVKKGHVYVCERCLDFKESSEVLERHIEKCWLQHPPGDEIFRQDRISVFEVDGEISKMYCQNLCHLAKFFIYHKTLLLDVEPFLFYVLIVWDSTGPHFAGYFSKQKYGSLNNLSCIATMPTYQGKGYGRFLLSRREGTTGSPEHPLSALGKIAYRSYWKSALLEFFKSPKLNRMLLSMEEIAKATGIAESDVVATLEELEMLGRDEKGKIESLIINSDLVEAHWEKVQNDPNRIWINEDNLKT
ncbi:unnamed protein product [Gongylonema pulchrum]|uniref:histone acetyltransferase n=1 Tax=Gongylonema pulchrum TaxID=637853 RepID=A0A183D4R6_9BILA|nr:unnamed protein product [Gongylonema pulchrum]